MRHNRLRPILIRSLISFLLGGACVTWSSTMALSAFTPICQSGSPSWLGLVGGGTRPSAFLDQYLARAAQGSERGIARVLIVAWASEVPEETAAAILKELQDASKRTGIQLVEMVSLEAPSSAKSFKTWTESFTRASAIWVTGGDQNRILDFLDRYPEQKREWQKSYCSGVAWGGTSAGTAIHSEWAMTGEADLSRVDAEAVELRRGTGFLRGLVVDQHFLKRSRMNRLWSALKARPGFVGLGIDEGTAWVFEHENQVRVLGESQVFCASPISSSGDAYHSVFIPSGATWRVDETGICSL